MGCCDVSGGPISKNTGINQHWLALPVLHGMMHVELANMVGKRVEVGIILGLQGFSVGRFARWCLASGLGFRSG